MRVQQTNEKARGAGEKAGDVCTLQTTGALSKNVPVDPQGSLPSTEANASKLAAFLRSSRQRSGLLIAELSTQTKIPLHSLQHLENAELEKLPAEVFVRGFIRSYLQHTGECTVVYPKQNAGGSVEERSGIESDIKMALDLYERCFDDDDAGFEARYEGETTHESPFAMVQSLWRGDSKSPKQVTVAAVVLAIVATLTMSYLLRRPSDRGDGVTLNNAPALQIASSLSDGARQDA